MARALRTRAFTSNFNASNDTIRDGPYLVPSLDSVVRSMPPLDAIPSIVKYYPNKVNAETISGAWDTLETRYQNSYHQTNIWIELTERYRINTLTDKMPLIVDATIDCVKSGRKAIVCLASFAKMENLLSSLLISLVEKTKPALIHPISKSAPALINEFLHTDACNVIVTTYNTIGKLDILATDQSKFERDVILVGPRIPSLDGGILLMFNGASNHRKTRVVYVGSNYYPLEFGVLA
jgi:hypothetical protein